MLVVYVLLGALLIHILQTSPLFDFIRRRKLGAELLGCAFCTGCWVFTILTFVFPEIIPVTIGVTVPLVSNLFVGIVTAWAYYLGKTGWEAK